ncbi:hypothetical protein UPYG_G00131770 [Umbra pygmaea]|uniref:chitin synthase n=1 Tax=Umbra pygmaea TaxID=75934 RepID=A0ABD0WTL0_UMBPY
MPFFDIVTNVMLLNSISFLSTIFQVAAHCIAPRGKRFIAAQVISIILILAGYILFIISYLQISEDREIKIRIGLAIAGTILISLNWWENYSILFQNPFLTSISEDIAKSRNLVGILSSVVRIIVTACVVGAYVPLSGMDWSTVTSVPKYVGTVIWILVGVQLVSSALGHWFVVVAFKIHGKRRIFLLPLYLASLCVVAAFIAPVIIFYQRSSSHKEGSYTTTEYCNDITYGTGLSHDTVWYERIIRDITYTLCPTHITSLKEIGYLVAYSLCWWLGWVLCTMYIWSLQFNRIARTEDLFVRRMYEGVFLEQSTLLNIRFEFQRKRKRYRKDDPVTVYLCATMWHESYNEMMRIIISMFRMDKFRPKNPSNDVSFESHIYFDDAFKDVRGSQHRHLNKYAEDLVEVIQDVYRLHIDDHLDIIGESQLQDSHFVRERLLQKYLKILYTPYGGRLEYTLPHGNLLMVHFKDKTLIRHKKRWSQIMYMYYILGWQLNRKYFKKFQQLRKENDEEFEKDVEFEKEILRKEMKKEKHNTYILTLDGDTDFQPSAVMLLIDRLKLYPHVGAACGRIHPTGTGPMVWYQKFEYAIGHWLQKTAEHVFGCVLCSPGCFSLYRGAALMDNNVSKTYTTKAAEASHYIQYDQGEDRWLCTLLLQQGWRVEYNAASDAYTNAPQDFKEFYNQRRRWGPSTMANTIDLLGSGSLTSQRNSSISKPFILYQILNMGASILTPATVCLMIAGCLTLILNIHPNISLFLAVTPPVVYLILCYKLKLDTQITIAAVLSVLYAFLMIATILSIIASIVIQSTLWTPSAMFTIILVVLTIITAGLHPKEFHLIIYSVVYFVSIPSGYLFLTIYSMVNMNNVSWGTRETSGPNANPSMRTTKQCICLTKCCRGLSWDCVRVKQKDQATETVVMTDMTENVSDLTPHQEHHQNIELHSENIAQDWVEQLEKTHGFTLYAKSLLREEEEFWIELQRVYLDPLIEDKAKQIRITADLKTLRNQMTFIYFICNAFWLVATFTVQAIGNPVTIPIPKENFNLTQTYQELHIEPIGLMFLFGFTLVMLIQFVGMLYHRVYTLIHYVAVSSTNSKTVLQESNAVQIQDLFEEETELGDETDDSTYFDESYILENSYITESGHGTLV